MSAFDPKRTLEVRRKKLILALLALGLFGFGQVRAVEPAFQRDPTATHSLIEKARTVKRGDSRAVVTEKLGPPDSETALARKEKPEVVGYSMRYDLVRWERGLVN